ncbi:MAG: hypothetical protein WBA13_06335 [Microcoleaceae cyanobacterium]
MHQMRVRGLRVLASWAALLLLNGVSPIEPASAQTTCQPPEENEYLLLIVSQTSTEQQQLLQTLPSDIESEVCEYVDDVVTRVGGFEDRLIAEDWAAYLEDAVGLQAYIVKPGSAEDLTREPDPEPPQNRQSAVRQVSRRSAFNPEQLGPGYAVLVDYLNQPELAEQLRQTLNAEIGLVSYGQRPYLLIEYTRDAVAATSRLNDLSQEGFLTLMVDSRLVTVIRPQLD